MGLFRDKTIEEIYGDIIAFADDRLFGIGGNWRDRGFKGDFFRIFSTAFYCGYCKAAAEYPKSTFRKDPSEVFIDRDHLKKSLRQKWNNYQIGNVACDKLINELADVWEEWTYAWRNHPSGLKRKYVRRSSSQNGSDKKHESCKK